MSLHFILHLQSNLIIVICNTLSSYKYIKINSSFIVGKLIDFDNSGTKVVECKTQ